MRRIPELARHMDAMVALIEEWLQRVEWARTTSAEPPTRRMRSKPIPGQLPANVEYSRRNSASFQIPVSDVALVAEAPKRVPILPL